MADILEDLFADVPAIEPKGITKNLYPGGRIWLDFDKEADDIAMFFNDDARRGIYAPSGGGLCLIVHPETHEIVGFYVVGWKQRFVNHNAELGRIWNEIERLTEEQPKSLVSQIMDAFRSLGAPPVEPDNGDYRGLSTA